MNYDNAYLSCRIDIVEAVSLNGIPRLRVQGTIKNPSAYSKVFLLAPNPPTSMTSYHGSGLPYPCPSQAFDNTPSKKDIVNASFDTTIHYPNSYYATGGMEKISPSVFFGFIHNSSVTPIFVRLDLPDLTPLRTLTYRPTRKDPDFYAKKASIIGVPDSQEALLRMSENIKVHYGVA